MQDSYLWISGLAQIEMRLLVEGAIALYENEGTLLWRLAMHSGQTDAADALEAIGNALQKLREHIINLQAACADEMQQSAESAKEA